MSDPRKNRGNGKEAEKADKLRKAATAPKGRHSQSRGSSKHNTSPQYAKPMKNRKTDFNDDTEF